MPLTITVLGALVTLAGAAALVLAFRQGQADRPDDERLTFRRAVALLAGGSLLLLVGTVLQTSV
ncbi:hypothetical protein [Cellulomonas carbonis]|uniref:Uncharacterized protein n=1 Tax=Cellulomonas carbonis T26 TaxID=947969 RepID=A0A0A0BQA6_9CELL|nr:hypothetical protein [Cellulomonas carbonis]KGM10663.1 hypothetical protein N868_14240 [Cellulomonas carbonis T26]MDT0164220.1 hypothetical protein [Actinotalea sp. AC32]GGB92248.1 hypothetical protein GCM10010972_01150 [Cellulomonas carbonis]